MSSHPHFFWTDLFQSGTAEQKTSAAHVLSNNILFKNLTHRELSYLAGVVYERVYQPCEPIFQQNDRGLGMYIIAKGQVSIKSQGVKNGGLILADTDQPEGWACIRYVDKASYKLKKVA